MIRAPSTATGPLTLARVRGYRIAATCTAAALLLGAGCGRPLDAAVERSDQLVENPDGLSWLSRLALDGLLEAHVWAGRQSGFVAMFALDGEIVYATTSGYADVEAAQPMQLDTRFRFASMTKPVTAVAAMQLIEEGKLRLDDPVARYIPVAATLRVASAEEGSNGGPPPTVPLEHPLTVRHLMTFTAGIGADKESTGIGRIWKQKDLYGGSGTLAERVDRILTAPLYEQPGETWRYGWSSDVLARVVEVAADEPFDQLLTRRIFLPLGMSSTSFLPPPEARERLARVYTQDPDGQLVRVESLFYDADDWTPGGSGLVSTAGDYLRFALMLWNQGTYEGVQILSPESVALMTRPHVESGVLTDWDMTGLGWGLGVAVVIDAESTPMIDRDGDYWWSGYYGTTFFVSPKTGLVGVVLGQNEPGPYSTIPYVGYVAQAIAYFGL